MLQLWSTVDLAIRIKNVEVVLNVGNVRHNTSLCDQHNAVPGYIPTNKQKSLPAIVLLKIQREILWANLQTASGWNFISSNARKKLNLSTTRHECRQIVTVNGVRKQSLPLYEVTLNSLDGRAKERMEIAGFTMPDFTEVKRPAVKELQKKYEHARNKTFYMTANNEYPIHLILGDSTIVKRDDGRYEVSVP